MPQLDHKGPEGKGPRTGRGLGKCRKPGESSQKPSQYELGEGMGLKRKAGCGKGEGRRLKSNK